MSDFKTCSKLHPRTDLIIILSYLREDILVQRILNKPALILHATARADPAHAFHTISLYRKALLCSRLP